MKLLYMTFCEPFTTLENVVLLDMTNMTDTYTVVITNNTNTDSTVCVLATPASPRYMSGTGGLVAHLFVEGLSQNFLLACGDLAGVLPHPLEEQEPVPVRVESEAHADLQAVKAQGKRRQSAHNES